MEIGSPVTSANNYKYLSSPREQGFFLLQVVLLLIHDPLDLALRGKKGLLDGL